MLQETKMALFLLSVLASASVSTVAVAEDEGDVAGHVLRSRDSQPVAEVPVQIKETGAKATTNAQGAYTFSDLPPGAYTVIATPSGTAAILRKVMVTAGKTTQQDMSVGADMTALESIVVLAQRTPETVARQAQMEAPNLINIETYEQIRKLPDITTAEAVRRIPGISLETDEGEGRYVNIRGLDADLNSTTFGGLRLPPTNNASPFGGYRAVTLDSIPIGLVGAITVTKSNLPSQDAEALGGTIEITPKTAPQNGAPFIQGNLGSGYEPLGRSGIIDVAVTGGGRFGGGSGDYDQKPFSVVVTLSENDDRRAINDVEPDGYFNDPIGSPGARPYDAISDLQQRDYELHRKRHGYGIDLGFQPDSNNSYYLRAFDAGYTEYYLRQFLWLLPDGNATPSGNTITDTLAGTFKADGSPATIGIQKALRDEKETSRDLVIVLGGKNILERNTLDYRVGYTQGTYSKPWDYNSSFTYVPPSGVAASPTINYSLTGPGHTPSYQITGAPGYLDPANYQLNGFSNSSAYNYDKELSFAANLDVPLTWGGLQTQSIKVGASARLRKKRETSQPYSYPNLPPLPGSSASCGVNEVYYSSRYQNGVDICPGYLQSVLGYGTIQASDRISAEQQYLNDKEDVYAVYGQYQVTIGPLGIVGGVRVENTQDHSSAFATSTDASGNQVVSPINATNSYTNYFPGLQARYELAPDLLTRASYSSTLARPGFNQSTPSLNIDLGSSQATTGNPSLKPATSNSFDISIEKYLQQAGILSLGIFDKEISNYIVANVVPNQTVPGYGGIPLKLFTFTNAKSSYSRGVEFNWEQHFRSLPGILSGLGASANYTFVDSRFEIRPGEHSTLPSSSKNTWNAAVFYEKGGVNLRVAGYSVSDDLFAIGGDRTGDVYNAKRTFLDFGSSYGFAENWVFYFDIKNLLNTPHTFYMGSSERVIQREFYGQTYKFGVRFDY
jgi:TonB-dependent receptor